MKYLNQFLRFAADPFFHGKTLTATGIREWLDHETKAKLGWIVDTVITADATEYKHRAGEVSSNLYEKLALKTPGKPSISLGDSVLPVNPVCTVYGDFRNQLSVRCDDVVVAPAAAGKVKLVCPKPLQSNRNLRRWIAPLSPMRRKFYNPSRKRTLCSSLNFYLCLSPF